VMTVFLCHPVFNFITLKTKTFTVFSTLKTHVLAALTGGFTNKKLSFSISGVWKLGAARSPP